MPQRDEKGRFVRADAKPVLHRQVDQPWQLDSMVNKVEADAWTAEWLQRTAPREPEPKGSLWPWLFLVGVLALVITGMFAAAVDGGLM